MGDATSSSSAKLLPEGDAEDALEASRASDDDGNFVANGSSVAMLSLKGDAEDVFDASGASDGSFEAIGSSSAKLRPKETQRTLLKHPGHHMARTSLTKTSSKTSS